MVDQSSQFFAILTNVGAAKQANADALGIPWNITQMGVGDANGTDPTPSPAQTRLLNEWRRAPLNQLKVDDKDPSIIVAEQVIPADVGGHWIREIALYDADGDMVAVANCAPTYKPLLSQGSGRTQVVRMNLIVSSSSNVQLKIDPSVVLATREYVDATILSVLPKNKVAGTYTKVTINERGIVQSGENPTTLGGYGITDAYTKTAVDTALAGKAGKATTLGGYGITDAYTKTAVDTALDGKAGKATTLGGYGITDAYTKTAVDTALALRAPLNSPKFTGTPEVPTPSSTDWGGTAVNTKYFRDFMHGLTHIDVAGSGEFVLTDVQAGKRLLYLVGVLTGDRTIILPGAFSSYTIRNATGGAFKLTVKMPVGVGVEVAQGKIASVFTDASNTLLCHTDYSALENAIAAKAALESPTFTGVPKGPTAAAGTSTQQLSTTAFVQTAVGDRLKVGDVSQQRPRLASPVSTGNWDSTALEIREVQLVAEWNPAEVGDQWGPGIAFHWAGKYGGKLHMDATGHLKWSGFELQTKQAAVGFLSGHIQITAGAPVVVSHNLGYVPSLDSVEILWECVTAQAGWQPGESFKYLTWMQDNISVASTTGSYAYDVNASTVTIGFGTTSSNWAMPTKGTGVAVAMTLANWRARVRIKP